MNTITLNYSRYIENSVTTVEKECALLTLSDTYWLLSASIGVGMTSTLLFLKTYRRLIANIGKHEEIDPDDILVDDLLALQQRIKLMHSKLPERHRLLRWLLRLMHYDIGFIRTSIMEHDADLSEITGTFSNTTDLLKHLNKL